MTIKFNQKIGKFKIYKKHNTSNRPKYSLKKQVLQNTINTSTRILLMY